MRQICSFEELSPLLSAQLKRGVVTNAFLSESEWRSAIETGLMVSESDSSLLLLRQKEGFSQLYFYLHPPFDAISLEGAGTLVTEFVIRPRDDGKEQPVLDVLEAAGLKQVLQRVRLVRKAGMPVEPSIVPVRLAKAQDLSAAVSIFGRYLDRYISCLPTADKLAQDIEDGLVLVADVDGEIGSLLQFSISRTSGELLHLATLPECRGRGLADALIRAQLSLQNFAVSRVWTGKYNTAALNLYYKYDYHLDGWRSVVLKGDSL